MHSKLDTVDEDTNNDEQVVEVPLREAKKADKKKVVTGKSSMAPPRREHHGPRQTLSEALNTQAFSQSGSRLQREKPTGLNACFATSHRVAEKQRPIPVIWDNPDACHEDFAYEDLRQAHFS
jgi:hypothetical protein